MTADECVDVATRMRSMGAVHVRVGDFEVRFGPLPVAKVSRSASPRVSDHDAERAKVEAERRDELDGV